MIIRPSIPQLEAFYWVGRLGSVKEAAHHLNMSQPTISLRINDLEQQLGYAVFERSHRKLSLSAQGERLLPVVTSIINDLTSLRQLAVNVNDVAGVVRVGLTEVLAQTCLAECMKRLSNEYPDVELDIVVGTSTELEQSAHNRQLDLAFVINPRGNVALTMTQLGIQEASWVASPELNLPKLVTPEILATTRIVTSPYPSPMYQLIVEWFRQGEIEPYNICRCTSIGLAVELVKSGIGAGFLPDKLIIKDLKAGRLIRLDSSLSPAPARLFCLSRSADQSKAVAAVKEMFEAVMQDMNFLALEAPADKSPARERRKTSRAKGGSDRAVK